MAMHYYQLDRASGKMVKKQCDLGLKNSVFNTTFESRKRSKVIKKSAEKTSKFRGVSYLYSSLRWRAYITIKNELICLGTYSDERAAALAYDHKAIQLGRKTNILQPRA